MEITKEDLINFEKKVKEVYEAGKIRGPVHLSGNNEDILIEIFKSVDKNDWVFSSWRNHYHALLHGIEEDELFRKILDGRSMSINSKDRNFYSSSIVGGIIPIALGSAMALKKKKSKNKVWCFIGDMTFETGVFHECYKYAKNFDLPLKFVVEHNNLSTNTPTDLTWNKKSEIPSDIIYYIYERLYPHHCTGSWVLF